MLTLTFTPEDMETLRTQRFEHPHPHVQLKMETVYLRSQGVTVAQTLQVCNLSKATYYRYLQAYQNGGVEALKTLSFYQPKSQLQEHRTTLEAYFLANPRQRWGKPVPKSSN